MAVYSYSKLGCFKRCPFQYKLTYIDRIKTGIENIEAFLGNCFHDLMEEIFSSGREKDYFLEELIARFHALWKTKWHSRIRLSDPAKTIQDYLRHGERCVENFYREYLGHGTGFSSSTLGLELKIEFPIDPAGKNSMVGYVDRLALTPDGTVEIQDYKTSATMPDPQELKESRQLAIYQMGLLSGWKKEGKEPPPLRFILYYVGQPQTFILPPKTREELLGLLSQIQAEIEIIQQEKLFPAHLSKLCLWCSYQDLCPEYQKNIRSQK